MVSLGWKQGWGVGEGEGGSRGLRRGCKVCAPCLTRGPRSFCQPGAFPFRPPILSLRLETDQSRPPLPSPTWELGLP